MTSRTCAVTRRIPAASAGSSCSICRAMAPSGSSARRAWPKASVVTANPGGTRIPAAVISPRLAAFPPTAGRSPPRTSASGRTRSGKVTSGRSADDGDHAAVTVDAYPLPGPDPLGRLAGSDHRGHAVLARDDGGVGHGPADVGHGGLDLAEDGSPARRGHRADEDLPVADLADLVDILQDPGGAFHDAGRRGVSAYLLLVAGAGLVVPRLDRVLGDAPQHLHGRVVERFRHRAQRRRRRPGAQHLEHLLA